MPKKRIFDIAPLPFEVTATLEDIGYKIALARKERRLSQREFSAMLGVATATLVSIEKGLPTVQIGHYARALWLLEIPEVIGDFGRPEIRKEA